MNVYWEKYLGALVFEVYGITFSLRLKKNEFKLIATNVTTDECRLIDDSNFSSFSNQWKNQINRVINCMNINNMYIHKGIIYIKILHDTFITPNDKRIIMYWNSDHMTPITSLASYQALSESEQANIEMLLGNINTYSIALTILNI